MTRTIHKFFAVVSTLFLMLMIAAMTFPATAFGAESSAGSSDIGFYVQAKIPDNQIDKTLTYYDLLVQPGQSQQLEVEIINETSKAVVVDVSAISASTNRNGVIDYKTPDICDETLKIPFSGITTLSASTVTVPANGSATLVATVSMPANAYDGVVLGGLVFTKQAEQTNAGEGNLSIQNVYSYVVGVKLTETDAVVSPDFEVVNIKSELLNYQPVTVHYIRNKEAAIVKNMNLGVTIYAEGQSEPVAQVQKTGIDMAPNSVMPLAVSMLNSQLAPGSYTSVVTLEKDGKNWTLEESFTIGRQEANSINNGAIPLTPAEPSAICGLPVWIIILLVVLLLIIAILLLLLLFKRRRRDDEQQNNVKKAYHKHNK